jgi:hypothetical protein
MKSQVEGARGGGLDNLLTSMDITTKYRRYQSSNCPIKFHFSSAKSNCSMLP